MVLPTGGGTPPQQPNISGLHQQDLPASASVTQALRQGMGRRMEDAGKNICALSLGAVFALLTESIFPGPGFKGLERQSSLFISVVITNAMMLVGGMLLVSGKGLQRT